MSERKYYYKYKLKRYYYKPKEIYCFLKQNAKRRNLTIKFSYKEFFNWYIKQYQRCHYCKRTLKEVRNDFREKRPQKRLSIDRIDNEKPYTLDNITLACLRCNFIKSDYFSKKEMKLIGMFIKRKIWTKAKMMLIITRNKV